MIDHDFWFMETQAEARGFRQQNIDKSDAKRIHLG
jgi:hypothetical protein